MYFTLVCCKCFLLSSLRQNSKINGIVFLPWQDQDVSELRIVSPIPIDYKDPDGLPALAEKQKSKLKGWMRPTELCEDPKMVYLISSFTIKQVKRESEKKFLFTHAHLFFVDTDR